MSFAPREVYLPKRSPHPSLEIDISKSEDLRRLRAFIVGFRERAVVEYAGGPTPRMTLHLGLLQEWQR